MTLDRSKNSWKRILTQRDERKIVIESPEKNGQSASKLIEFDKYFLCRYHKILYLYYK